MIGTEGFVQGIVGPSTGPRKVIHGEAVLQLSHLRLHLLWVRFALMMCQGFLGQDELVQLMGDVEVSTLLIGHKRRIELLRLQLLPIKWGEPTMAPDLLRVRDARPTTQSLLRVTLEKSEDGGGTFATDWSMALRGFPDRMCQDIVPHFVRRVAVKRAPVPE